MVVETPIRYFHLELFTCLVLSTVNFLKPLKQLTIGRCMSLLCSSICCIRNPVVWKMVPSSLFWCLWREMNDRIFEDRERTLKELKSLFFLFFFIFIWMLRLLVFMIF